MEKTTIDEETRLKMQKSRIIFLTLLDAGLNYRNDYRAEDIEAYDKMVVEHVTKHFPANKKNDREAIFRSTQEMKKMNIRYAQQRDNLTAAMEQDIQTALLGMSPEYQMGFKASANALQMLIEEFFKAKNTNQLIGLARSYNNGIFDKMFEETPQQKLELLKIELENVDKWLHNIPEGSDAEDLLNATNHKIEVLKQINALQEEHVPKIEGEGKIVPLKLEEK